MPRTKAATPTAYPHPRQARTLGFLLREVYGLLQQRVYDSVVAAGHSGLRAMHSPVLRQLPPEGGRVADLARATGMAKQSVTYVVDDLVALGYLRTEPDPDDARARRITYTALGRRLLAALMDASDQAEKELALALGKDQVLCLRGALEAVLDGALPSDSARAKRASRSAGR